MAEIKILILDDNKETFELLEEAKALFDNHTFNIKYVSTLPESLTSLAEDSNYDFAIVDLALSSAHGDEGNYFIDHLVNKYNIYPIVYSGQPEKTTHKTNFISKLTRGEQSSEDILQLVVELYSTGITTLLGENGTLQKHITNFYWENLSKIYSTPELLIKSGIEAESLTRLYLNYLHNDLVSSEDDEIRLHADELYVIPQKESKPVNGSIIEMEENVYLVITPRCDIRTTDKYQLLKIGSLDPAIQDLVKCNPNKRLKEHDKIAAGKSDKKHVLPPSTNFNGGIIDFLDVHTYNIDELRNIKVIGKVANEMMRNITSRFSSFYARQGQPIYNMYQLIQEN